MRANVMTGFTTGEDEWPAIGPAPDLAARDESNDHDARKRDDRRELLSQHRTRGMQTFRFSKVHPAGISREWLETLGVSPAGGHRLYAARARSA